MTAGQILYIFVGGDDVVGAGYNGGGGADRYGRQGGGGSDIRSNPTDLMSRLIVAGAGGASNRDWDIIAGGNGGTTIIFWSMSSCTLIANSLDYVAETLDFLRYFILFLNCFILRRRKGGRI